MSHRRILIVEEDANVRDELAEALAERGAPVAVAADGEEALRQLRAGSPPAVVLLDLRMPGLGGEAVLRALRDDARYEDVPVITMSGGGEERDRDAAANVRAPFDVESLLQVVLSLLATNVA